jgi:alpha-glucosidase
LRNVLTTTLAALEPRAAWPTWVLSNHDFPRHRTRYGGSEAYARAAAVLLLTLQGTPFMYAGEELGLLDAEVPPERVQDPAGRDGCRAPVPWTPAAPHGWSAGAEPWLPWPPTPEHSNAEVLREDPTSILHLYKSILTLRRDTPALRLGAIEILPAPPGVLAFRRGDGPEAATVIINFTDGHVPYGTAGVVALSTARSVGENEEFDGTLQPDEAIILR